MSVRTFSLKNTETQNNTWYFTSKTFKCFLNDPNGLGFTRNLTTDRYGNVQKLVDISDSFPTITGQVLFYDDANSSRYDKYNDFCRFISHNPCIFYYQIPTSPTETYTLDCEVVSLTKSETKSNGILACDITINGLSFWKGDAVESKGATTTRTIVNNGDFPVGFEITIEGTPVNPYITLEQDSTLYGEAKFIDASAFAKVYIDSNDGEQLVELTQGGSILANPLAYQDLSISNGSIYTTFIKLARGTSTITIGMDSGSITKADIKFTPIYRSV